MRRRFSIKILWILLVGASVFTISIETFHPFRPKTVRKIYIRADGSFYPPTTPAVPIETVDKIVYTFTDNINKSIVVERSHIIIDGGGFTMHGDRFRDGFTLQNIVNVTIKNTIINAFSTAIILDDSDYNTVSGNKITNNAIGVHLEASSGNTVSENNITNNGGKGVRFSYFSKNNTVTGNTIRNNHEGVTLSYSPNNLLHHNRFINNTIQTNIVGPDVSIWDDGYPSGGNYWSDYEEKYPNATELDDSGLWDTPYVINEENVDNYPIIPEFPSLILLPLFMIATVLAAIIYRKKHSLVG